MRFGLFLVIFFNIYAQLSLGNAIRDSNILDPDRAEHFVRPDLVLNCLQR